MAEQKREYDWTSYTSQRRGNERRERIWPGEQSPEATMGIYLEQRVQDQD